MARRRYPAVTAGANAGGYNRVVRVLPVPPGVPMFRLLAAAGVAVFAVTAVALAQDAKPDAAPAVKAAPSKVTAVTVYQTTALVTREVAAPEGAGLTEVVISPLPPAVVPNTLYAEGSTGIRVLSARYRTRAIAQDTRAEVRALEVKLKELAGKIQTLQADLQASAQNVALVGKLENFTSATLQTLTDKGQLDTTQMINLAKYIRTSRAELTKEEVGIKQQIEATQQEQGFTKRLLDEKSGGVSRTERDAVVVLDKKAGAGTVRLSYLVNEASWRPQYKLRAGTGVKDPVQLEYLAAITQETGEDWGDVALTLSTAQPLLSASPPDLLALEVSLGGGFNPSGPQGGGQFGQFGGGFGGGRGGLPTQPAPTGGPGMAADMPTNSAYLRGLEQQSQAARARAVDNLNRKQFDEANALANSAAAAESTRDLFITREELKEKPAPVATLVDSPSVTFRLKDKFTLPSRPDDQTVEVSRLELAPKFYYKAVPVLTPQVFRQADLTNTTELVLLPGEATMYVGGDFVGQAKLPLVAVGKPFTVGFGADPQLSASRKLTDKTREVKGGNQVLTFKYRLLLSSYKAGPVSVQVWDRAPHAEAANAITVSLNGISPKLSDDPLYLRDERPRNLLRWDVTVGPKQNGENASVVEYDYRLELALNATLGAISAMPAAQPMPAPRP